jgi:mandelate racemase
MTVAGLRGRAVDVPLARPVQTSAGTVATAPLVLIDLLTDAGVTGRGYVFVYTPLALRPVAALVENLGPVVRGSPVAPAALGQLLQRRFRLLGAQGLTGIALAGIDMAAWDALAKACGVSLVRLLGGEPRPIPAYRSLGAADADAAAREAAEAVQAGFRAVKVRLGQPDVRGDVTVVRAVRAAVGDGVPILTDYNQSLSVPEAVARGRVLDGEGVGWIEEPTRAEDFAGHARIREEVHTPIQLGENWWGVPDMAKSVAAGASDLVMLDAMKVGGVTGWRSAAAVAEAAGLPASSHLFVEVSAHLLAVTPTCHWLEHLPVADPVLREPMRPRDGHAEACDAPGVGLEWDEAAVGRYAVA